MGCSTVRRSGSLTKVEPGTARLEAALLAGHERSRRGGSVMAWSRRVVRSAGEVPFFMESAVFDVGTEDQGDGAGVIAGEAFEGDADGILFGAEVDGGV